MPVLGASFSPTTVNVAYLVAAVLLVVANGFFVGAEFALVAARRSKIEQLAASGDRRAVAALRSTRELSMMLAGAQLGITMASLGLGAIAEPAVAELLDEAIGGLVQLPEHVLHSISFGLALAIVVFFHMVVGEMAPKNLAIAQPEKSALWLALPFRFYANLFRPAIVFLNNVANGALRLARVEPRDELPEVHTSDAIGELVAESAAGGMLDAFEHRLLSGAIEFRDRDAAEIMIPRTDMTAVSLDASVEDIQRLILETGHSRIPLYEGDVDHVVGFVHAKDLLPLEGEAATRPAPRRSIRDMLVVPESRKLHPLLLDMRRERKHFALVVDEHGGTAGVLTLEDVLEELVGEIEDEYDQHRRDVEQLGEERFLVPGTLRIDEVADRLGVELPEGPYETVAGFLMDRLGRIPQRRDVVSYDGWLLRVLAMQRRRVTRVLVERDPNAPALDAEGEEARI